jgi:hypothetical protein
MRRGDSIKIDTSDALCEIFVTLPLSFYAPDQNTCTASTSRIETRSTSSRSCPNCIPSPIPTTTTNVLVGQPVLESLPAMFSLLWCHD